MYQKINCLCFYTWRKFDSVTPIFPERTFVGLRQIALKCFPSKISVNLVTYMLATVCSSTIYNGTRTGQLHRKNRESGKLAMMCIESNTQIRPEARYGLPPPPGGIL